MQVKTLRFCVNVIAQTDKFHGQYDGMPQAQSGGPGLHVHDSDALWQVRTSYRSHKKCMIQILSEAIKNNPVLAEMGVENVRATLAPGCCGDVPAEMGKDVCFFRA